LLITYVKITCIEQYCWTWRDSQVTHLKDDIGEGFDDDIEHKYVFCV